MKNIILKIAFFLFGITAMSQNTTILYDDTFVRGMTVDGDDLYFIASESNESSINKIDLTASNPTVSEILKIQGQNRPSSIVKKGNYLYVSFTGNIGPQEKEVVRIDLTQTNPQYEIIAKVNNPNGLAFRNDELYISSQSKIYRLDLTQINPTPQEFVDGLNVRGFGTNGLCIVGDFLYVTEEKRIVKYNLNLTNPPKELVASGFSGDLTGITASDDKSTLYFVDIGMVNLVYMMDVATETWAPLMATTLPGHYDVAHHSGNYLFVSAFEGFALIKINLNSLKINNYENHPVDVYPNPTMGLLNIRGLDNGEQAVLFDILGQALMKETVLSEMDISHLNNGIYFLKIGDRQPVKIIKK